MRVGFIGKGGSGKTTVAASFARHVAKKQNVLVIDGDVNSHIHDCFQMSPASAIGDQMDEIASYCKGTRSDLQDVPLIGTTPPAKGSRFIFPRPTDPLIKTLGVTKNNITLLSVGSYQESDIGVNCYHAKLASAELFLHHLWDSKGEVVVMDTTAGVDLLGTSLCMAFDYLVFVVEPSKKSLDVYHHFIAKFSQDTPVLVLGNKIRSNEDVDYLKQNNCTPHFLIPFDERLHKFERGEFEAFDAFVEAHATVFSQINEKLVRQQRDYKKYYQTLAEFHKNIARTWYDAYYAQPVSERYDHTFSFLDEIEGVRKNAN